MKPMFERLTKVLRSLYSKYLDLKHHFERLRGDYNRLQQRYVSLDKVYERVKGENRELKTVADNYDTLCRGFGKEKIAAKVHAIRDKKTQNGCSGDPSTDMGLKPDHGRSEEDKHLSKVTILESQYWCENLNTQGAISGMAGNCLSNRLWHELQGNDYRPIFSLNKSNKDIMAQLN